MPVKVLVTQEHIRRGHPLDPNACPIQQAVREHFPDANFVRAHRGLIIAVLENGERVLQYRNTHALRQWILRFDTNPSFIKEEAAEFYVELDDDYKTSDFLPKEETV